MMKMRKLPCLLLLLCACAPAAAAGVAGSGAAAPAPAMAAGTAADREAVRQAVLDYVEGFYQGDSTRLARSVWDHVSKYGYNRPDTATTYRGMPMSYPNFFRYAAGVRAGRGGPPPNAVKQIQIFDVQDQTASAKLTAWWGTDYLLLGRENGRWMITHVLWQSPPPRAKH
jgi:hypothetical protein